jgi:hypothetical protein
MCFVKSAQGTGLCGIAGLSPQPREPLAAFALRLLNDVRAIHFRNAEFICPA